MKLKSIVSPFAVTKRLLCLLVAAIGCIACEGTIFTDQSDCPRGLSLRFVYDYNMEYANAFPKKVDCLTLYVFDENGNYVKTLTETSAVLADEAYRMNVELDAGNYTLIAYGGLACGKTSFSFPQFTRATKLNELYVELKHNNFTSNEALHGLYYGKLNVSLQEDDFVEGTVYMMKNTNNVKIALQQINGKTIAASQFTFEITDDNSYLDQKNNVVKKGDVIYSPWTTGEEIVGSWEDNDTPVSVAWAEFSTSRLVVENNPRLTITNNETGDEVFSIPLKEYLLLLRSELYADMKAQEYLDRESEWSMVFFLDDGFRWVNVQIIINGWTVRLNHIDGM